MPASRPGCQRDHCRPPHAWALRPTQPFPADASGQSRGFPCLTARCHHGIPDPPRGASGPAGRHQSRRKSNGRFKQDQRPGVAGTAAGLRSLAAGGVGRGLKDADEVDVVHHVGGHPQRLSHARAAEEFHRPAGDAHLLRDHIQGSSGRSLAHPSSGILPGCLLVTRGALAGGKCP